MQIQPQSNLNFRGKEHITSPQKLAGMIRHLESKGMQYTVNDGYIYWGKARSLFLKQNAYSYNEVKKTELTADVVKREKELESIALKRFDRGVASSVREWQAQQSAKFAEIDRRIEQEIERLKLVASGSSDAFVLTSEMKPIGDFDKSVGDLKLTWLAQKSIDIENKFAALNDAFKKVGLDWKFVGDRNQRLLFKPKEKECRM